LKKLLVANRGEIACRVLGSARRAGIRTVAVYSQADATARHVELADERVAIGPAPARESYLVVDKILKAAAESGADAIHPGYGFLSENALFARAVIDARLTWVGPTPESIEAMGDKARARALAAKADVPLLPGTDIIADGDSQLDAHAAATGYPLLVKAAAGGGGIGMQQVDKPAQLAKKVASTRSMAERAFGDGSVFLERLVRNARHIEVQVFGNGDGTAVTLGERECSIQRRFQKVIEEAPAPDLPDHTRAALITAAQRLTQSVAYDGAGTIEFIVDADTWEFFFLEMNTRIQVEHPATEMAYGVDLVEMQLRRAAGEAITEVPAQPSNHAIECRLYAENPAKRFFPSPGPLTTLTLPAELPGVRIDTGFREGDEITMYYDPLIAKLIAFGSDRHQAIERMQALLAAARVEGIVSNLGFLRNVLAHPAFASGTITTDFINVHGEALLAGL
jgi:3-methylcrotonyl-CoA carboxylase alpha subunit